MDALTYFFFNLGLHNILLAVLAFLLGLCLGWLLWAKFKSQIDESINKQKKYESDIASLRKKLEQCEQKSPLETCSDEELAACQKKCAELEAKMSSLSAADAAKATVVSSAAGSGSDSKSRSFFDDALKSGKMREDKEYGLLYNSSPNEVDDLTKIKGVAEVLNKSLNEFGVYTYRQIALWSPQICEDFSEKLSFRGRIQRDDWVAQCKGFHQEKYGEKI